MHKFYFTDYVYFKKKYGRLKKFSNFLANSAWNGFGIFFMAQIQFYLNRLLFPHFYPEP
jgi:hypothetical protein